MGNKPTSQIELSQRKSIINTKHPKFNNPKSVCSYVFGILELISGIKLYVTVPSIPRVATDGCDGMRSLVVESRSSSSGDGERSLVVESWSSSSDDDE
ncbi:unnamed protein product [Dovyalis caffra]|uniref:Uncharacterized protein n=1 Tax=Dovyalis caffra TaxID=77055 RepID=A0AAV1SNW6_9ROSI|nr:unnamed protein product [Dovyalis caffra]